ncbi:TfoX/Sxy family protein [Micromonospora sp. CA-244673]|uniref:TfoX/Sxy family protein n=1 Tax=Micromonospora sp. CA-244673 TaxID=3239958 RepID=UPI003D8D23ED
MAYDEDLADRVRELVEREPGFAEKRMFGGLAMMVRGNMAVVVRGAGGLMVRIDPTESERLEAEPGAQATVMRGRLMRGWITVDPSACAGDADLARWVDRGVGYTGTLPAKHGDSR